MADQHEKRFLPFTFPQDILSQIALLLKFIETAADRFYVIYNDHTFLIIIEA